MVDLPKPLLVQAFDAELRRGVILRLEDYPLPSGVSRDKYFIVLNRDCAFQDLYHFLATSKVEKFRALPWGTREGVLIPAGLLANMPLDTIIDCHSLLSPLRRDDVRDMYCENRCRIVGIPPSGILTAIDRIIVESRSIPPAIKRLILP